MHEALIGRSTFYDHYSDKYDLLNKMVEELSNEFKPYIKIRFNLNNINDFTTTFSGMLKHLSKEKTKILALLNVHTEFADLHSNLENLLIKGCMDFLLNENFKSKFNISNEYICRHYASYVLTSFELWLELDESDGALELANNMQAILFAN